MKKVRVVNFPNERNIIFNLCTDSIFKESSTKYVCYCGEQMKGVCGLFKMAADNTVYVASNNNIING